MEIVIAKHAVTRYRQRLFDYYSSETTIKTLLMDIAHRGKMVRQKPGGEGLISEIRHNGIFIVTSKVENKVTVITCLGEKNYRKWLKNQNPYTHISGRWKHFGMNPVWG